MKQSKTFWSPVLKVGGAGALIDVGDPLTLILRDKSKTQVVCSDVTRGGREVSWDLLDASLAVTASKTSSQNATAAATDQTTADTLLNALKANYNALQVDIAAQFSADAELGAPTSVQNATTAASDLTTSEALANALKTNFNAAIVDLQELFARHPSLGTPTQNAAIATAASDLTTTEALANALKTAYNKMQVDVSEAFSDLDTGYYIPRSEDVEAVDSVHQAAPSGADDVHDEIIDVTTDDHPTHPRFDGLVPPNNGG